MNIIIIEPHELNDDGTVLLDANRSRHVCRVLKKTIGDEVRIGLLNGPLGRGRVCSLESGVTLECEFDESVRSLMPEIDLLLALPRPKVLKRLYAQLAAIGVGHVYLSNAEKVERFYFDTHVLNPGFIHEKLLEGLQQCGQTARPEVTVHRRFRVLLEDELAAPSDSEVRLLAHPGNSSRLAESVVAGTERILLAVGPEGGWTPYECDLLKSRGFRTISTGMRILRSDTACISLLTLAHDALQALHDA